MEFEDQAWEVAGKKRNNNKNKNTSSTTTHDLSLNDIRKNKKLSEQVMLANSLSECNTVNIFEDVLDKDASIENIKHNKSKIKKFMDCVISLICESTSSKQYKFICDVMHSIGMNFIKNDIVSMNSNDDDEDDVAGDSATHELYDIKIIILGVGKFTESYNSLLQFVLCIIIQRYIQLLRNTTSRSHIRTVSMSLFDPVMSDMERCICEDLYDIDMLTTNTYGKLCGDDVPIHYRHTSNMDDSNTKCSSYSMFYMPHCPYQLYCNILWSNWFQLHKIMIIGNSFESYELRRFLINSEDAKGMNHRSNNDSDEKACPTANVIQYLKPLTKESVLWNAKNTCNILPIGLELEQSTSYEFSLLEKSKHVMKYCESAYCETRFVLLLL